MIEVNQWNFKVLRRSIEVMVVELTHFSALIFSIFFEIGVLCVLKCLFEEILLILVRSFGFGLHFSLDLLNDNFLMLAQLLQLDISEFSIIEILIQNDVQILSSGLLFCDRFHLIRDMILPHWSLGVLKHRKVLIALHKINKY
jgi:hypothetical protein